MNKLVPRGSRSRMLTYLIALWKLFKHPQTPWTAKWVAIAVIAYAASPIDLIPDFIPILGHLDDLLIVPAGTALAVRLIPRDLLLEFREEAARRGTRPQRRLAAALIIAVWFVALGAAAFWVYRSFR
jgi:uncharacterized membrane protein YkvA (DUF1232 family)